MPLIIITGLPTSGKTTRALQLQSYLASRLATDPNAKYKLHLVSDDTQHIPRSTYDLSPSSRPAGARSATAPEKDARAALLAAVKRVLSDRDIVILDSANYIKGWRYQLHCEAKAARTPCAVLRVACSLDEARAANEARLARRKRREQQQQQGGQRDSSAVVIDEGEQEEEAASSIHRDDEVAKISSTNGHAPPQKRQDSPLDNDHQSPPPPPTDWPLGNTTAAADKDNDEAEPYDPASWENLVFRYEEPNPMTRWDSPLFVLTRAEHDTPPKTHAVFDALWDAVAGTSRPFVKPNQATVQRSREGATGADTLYVLDRETQDVVRLVAEHAASGASEVHIPCGGGGGGGGGQEEGENGEKLTVELPAGGGGGAVGVARLQRLRRAFVAMNRSSFGFDKAGNVSVARVRASFVGYLNDAFENDT